MKLKKKFTYDYPRPAVTVDVIVLSRERTPRVLLIRRKHAPFAGTWALPGGFVDADETLEAAARRELLEETGVRVKQLQQLHAFGDPGRDPRGWTISIVFIGSCAPDQTQARAADDAAEVAWHSLSHLPPLAFDHKLILSYARRQATKRKQLSTNPAMSNRRRPKSKNTFGTS